MALQNKSEFVFSDGVVWDQPFFVDLLLVRNMVGGGEGEKARVEKEDRGEGGRGGGLFIIKTKHYLMMHRRGERGRRGR